MKLAVVAVLSPAGVQRAVLSKILKGDGEAAHTLGRTAGADGVAPDRASIAVDDALARLVALSLLGWGPSGASVILHRLVGRVVRDHLHASGVLVISVDATVQVLRSLRIPEEQAWARREEGAELVAHAVGIWDIAIHHSGDDQFSLDQITRCADVANWAVHHLTVTADLSRATRLGAQVLGDCEQLLGPDHPNTLTCRTNLAGAYQSAGRLDQAIPLCEATLTERERVLGPDHPNTLASRNNVAFVYRLAGRLDQAIPLCEATLTERERVLGADHPKTLASRNNLAGVYRLAGRLGQAIELYETTLTDTERVLGPDHPQTRTVQDNLQRAWGKEPAAFPFFPPTNISLGQR
jgi:hypothetical protein